MAKNTKNAEKFQRQLLELLKEDCNKICADCHARGPRWASWNLGVFVCIRCSGIHRSLGVHISKVKSVNLDTWTQEQVDNMLAWGNGIANEYYEYKIPSDFKRPTNDQSAEKFIRNKYEKRLYVHDNFDYSSSVRSTSTATATTSNRTSTGGGTPAATSARTPEVKPAAVNAPVRSIPVVPLKTKSEGYTPPTVPQRRPIPESSQPSLLQVSLETNTSAKPKSSAFTSTSTTSNDLVDIFGDMVTAPPQSSAGSVATVNNGSINNNSNAFFSNPNVPQTNDKPVNSVNLLSDVKDEPAPAATKQDIKSSIMSLYGNTTFSSPQQPPMFNGGIPPTSTGLNIMHQQQGFNAMPHSGLNGFNVMPQGGINTMPQGGINTMPQGRMNSIPQSMNTMPQGMNTMPQSMNTMPQGVMNPMSMNSFQGMPQNNRITPQQYNLMQQQQQQQQQQQGMQYMMNPSVYAMTPQQQQQMMMSNQLILSKLQQQNSNNSGGGGGGNLGNHGNAGNLFGGVQHQQQQQQQQFNGVSPQQQSFSGQSFAGSMQRMQGMQQNFGGFPQQQQQGQQNQLNSVQKQMQQIKIGQQSTTWGFTS